MNLISKQYDKTEVQITSFETKKGITEYHLLFQQTCNKKRAHQVGGAEKALIGYFNNGQGQRKDTF